MNEQEARELLEKNPKLRKSVEKMYRVLGKINALKSIEFSSRDTNFKVTKEEIDRINKTTK
ncbi:MAG: hypothetical protein ACRCTJ_02805 [Brevinema sp.]